MIVLSVCIKMSTGWIISLTLYHYCFLKIVYHISWLRLSLVVQRFSLVKSKHARLSLNTDFNLLLIILIEAPIISLSWINICLDFLPKKNSYYLNNPRKTCCVTISCHSSDSRFRARCSRLLGSESKPIDSLTSAYKFSKVFSVV